MARRLIVLALAAVGTAAAAVLATRRGSAHDASRNGGSQVRTERLRRELEQARERLRIDIARAREQR